MEREQLRLLDRSHRRRPRLAVEERNLPDHLARSHQAEHDVLAVRASRRDLE